MFKKIFLQTKINPKNEKEKSIKNCYQSIWNEYINGEIRREKVIRELDELFGPDTLGKKNLIPKKFLNN